MAGQCQPVARTLGLGSFEGPHKKRNFPHDVRRSSLKPRPPVDVLADGPTFRVRCE